jgi:hypothetical protein
MGLPADLLDQARSLATLDARGRPRQANLRRAVSGCYYALFHFLIDRACEVFVGASTTNRSLTGILARAFDHGAMKRASVAFGNASFSDRLKPALAGQPIPTDLSILARLFVELQAARHAADYDRLARLERSEALRLIEATELAMRLWNNVRGEPSARLYLVALLVGERIRE